MKRILYKYFKRNSHYIILTISILSILLFKLTYISLILSILILLISLLLSNKRKKIKLIIITISLTTIIFNSINIYYNISKNQDVYKNENILLGSWLYNEQGGTYLFNENYTYIQYSNSNTENNYCQGTYKYSYGATENNITIKQDEKYYYYTLTLNEEKCYIMNQFYFDEYTKIMYIAISKNNQEVLLINSENQNIMSLTKEEIK